METKIQKTLTQWFPDAFTDMKINSDYEILLQFAKYTQKLISENCENKKEPFRIINLLYSQGSLHDKNAIENEFLIVLANNEAPASLKEHLDLMPETIKSIYIKTILGN